MKHEIERYLTFFGLLLFVVATVVFIQIAEAVEADRRTRFETCISTGETKLTCGVRSVFGTSHG